MATKNYSRVLLRVMAAGSLILGVSQWCAAAEGKSPASLAEIVVTIQPGDDSPSRGLQSQDVAVYQGKSQRKVLGFERLSGEQAAMQLFIYLDGSIGPEALRALLPDMKSFLETLPANTEVAVGSLHGGEFQLAQAFTTDRATAAAALKAPLAQSGTGDSAYSAVLYLAKRWPSQERMVRRAVLMLTDRNDSGYSAPGNNPYVEAATRDSQIAGIAVYSVYLPGAGPNTSGDSAMNPGQSNLLALSNATGGYSYGEGSNGPVSLKPHLEDLEKRLANQYRIIFEPRNDAGAQAVTVKTEMSGIKIIAPTRVYARRDILTTEVMNTRSPGQALARSGQ